MEKIYQDKRHNIEISEKDETVELIMNKLCWFSLISNRMFYPLNLINQQQVKENYSFSF